MRGWNVRQKPLSSGRPRSRRGRWSPRSIWWRRRSAISATSRCARWRRWPAADVLACEDTRVTRVLLDRYGIRQRPIAYHEHNAAEAGPKLIAALEAGKSVALVSDAGTPLVSDPGFRLVEQALAAGIRVVPIPGRVGGAGGADGVGPAVRCVPVCRLPAGQGRAAQDAAGRAGGGAGDADLLRIAAAAGRYACRDGRGVSAIGRRRSGAS